MSCGADHIGHFADRLHDKSGAPCALQHQDVRSFPERGEKNNPCYPLPGTGNLTAFKSLLTSSA